MIAKLSPPFIRLLQNFCTAIKKDLISYPCSWLEYQLTFAKNHNHLAGEGATDVVASGW